MLILQVVSAALATHLYYRTYEPKYEPRNLLTVGAVLFVEPIVLLLVSPAWINLTSILSTYALFLASLVTSIVLYRLSPFHPLAKFPGPTINKVTQLWSIWIQSTGHQHLVNKQLHDKYGPFVRVGPNELSVIDIDAALAILGPGGISRGRYYDTRQDPRAPGNLLALRGQAHTDRRRLWARAFTNESLAEFDIPLKKRVEILVEKLAEVSKGKDGEGAPIDLSSWFSLFSLDFMGDLCFGGGFELVHENDSNNIRGMFENFTVAVSMVCHVPWAARTLTRFPFLSKSILMPRKFAVEHSTSRIQRGAQTKDLWYHLSDEAGNEKSRPPTSNVIADGALAMIAGSDTTATGISSFFYLLLSNPKCYKALQEEVDRTFPSAYGTFEVGRLSEMAYLNACINEALRLFPPLLTSGPREVPIGSGGRIFSGRYIPEGTQVYLPPYSIHRNPAHFSPQTNEFVPERWLNNQNNDTHSESPSGPRNSDSEDWVDGITATAPTRGSRQSEGDGFLHNSSAFMPFSHGQANCIGRNLARREIAVVVCAIIQRFEVEFDVTYDRARWEKDLGDYFVSKRGELVVRLVERF